MRRAPAWIAFLLPTAALAAGIEFPDNGAVSTGRGGAFAADPTDGVALQVNPAGLAWQKGLRLTVDTKLAFESLRYAPADATQGKVAENSAGGFFLPGGVLSYGLGEVGPLSGLTFALGGVGPNAIGKLSYPADGAQRYELISSDYFIAYVSAAVAASLGDWLSIGLTAQNVNGTAKFSQAVWADIQQGNDPAQDSIANIDVASNPGSIWTGVLGATVRPMKALSVGLSFRPGFEFNGDGTLKSTLPASAELIHARPEGEKTKMTLNFPPVARFGAQYRVSERLLGEVGFVWEGWSVLKNVDVLPQDIVIKSDVGEKKLGDIHLVHNLVDAWSARIGGDYVVIPDLLTVRAGYLYETSAIETKDVAVDFANWGRHALSVGASVKLFGATLDLAYAHHFVPSQNVTNSEVKQVTTPDMFGVCPENNPTCTSSVIGNGKFDASFDVVAIGLTVPLGALSRSPFAAPAAENPAP